MSDKISSEFMAYSKKIMNDDPDLKEKLEKVMGKVADGIVKKKYVEPEECQDESDSCENDSSA